jgi:hypothetical protein
MDRTNPQIRQVIYVPQVVGKNTTIRDQDAYKIWTHAVAGTITFTLPQAKAGYGPYFFLMQGAANIIKITPGNATDKISNLAAGASYTMAGSQSFLGLFCEVAGTWSIVAQDFQTTAGGIILPGPVTIATGPFIVDNGSGTPVFEVTGATTGITVEGFGPNAGGLVDMTPDKGFFTVTLTGVTPATTGTATWVRNGLSVVIWLPSLVNTSNTTACTLTGIPAELQPASVTQNLFAVTENNSVVGASVIQIPAGSGTWTVFNGLPPSSTFTAANSKGIPDGASLSYQLS